MQITISTKKPSPYSSVKIIEMNKFTRKITTLSFELFGFLFTDREIRSCRFRVTSYKVTFIFCTTIISSHYWLHSSIIFDSMITIYPVSTFEYFSELEVNYVRHNSCENWTHLLRSVVERRHCYNSVIEHPVVNSTQAVALSEKPTLKWKKQSSHCGSRKTNEH